ncbi:MAG TPA: HD domain-containing protein [Flavilitoribacter sp.]|nr:HD domain-containing protein [Flavilitoribacter sp.]HMQ86138.1 HD domain-containing protein [Flavilitoribacter sp.]
MSQEELRNVLAEADQATRVQHLFDFMRTHGSKYYEEEVTQMEHALQTAYLARAEASDPSSTAAALLHDLGHFLADSLDRPINPTKVDDLHENLAADFLRDFFPPEVTEPIRLHVDAKRYLCSVDTGYYGSLSEASKKSFHLQGGRMNDEEISAFEQNPYYRLAVRLRIWDDKAKEVGKDIPELEHYAQEVAAALLP